MFTYNYMFNKDILFQDKKISANLIFTTQLGFFEFLVLRFFPSINILLVFPPLKIC
jgi:hypothetical protein